MNKDILRKHIDDYLKKLKTNDEKFRQDWQERKDDIQFYQEHTKEKILQMNEESLYHYFSRLWAMLMWGNKRYKIQKMIDDNGIDTLKNQLADLVWGDADIAERWDKFRVHVKGMGPAMMSEILCKTCPQDFMIWNRRAFVGLRYLEVENLPRYDYQLNGETYKHLCEIAKEIAKELANGGVPEVDLLTVDYFIWEELQVEDNLSKIHSPAKAQITELENQNEQAAEFIHNEVRDKIRDIGEWLGFDAKIEQKVSEGSKVDAVWEATIGNMGRIIYVFEVQTKGNIDSLIVNLLKALNNPAVQGVVAISDESQLEKIKRHAADVKDLRDKLKYWNYEEVLKVHESLEFVNSCINHLGLVPQRF